MRRLLSYYGDDFTGSTDVMEALAINGIRTVLFTRQPTPENLAGFADYRAIGLAGTSRSETPDWMDEHLPPAFSWLKSLGAEFCHYKVCSTFDSSPNVGSIGRALEIGLRSFGQSEAVLIVGAPQLKRYTFAGNLFSAYQGAVYRIDRHPVMSRHPVTPMHESDLLRHLAMQTTARARLLDVFDEETQRLAGATLLEEAQQNGSNFVIGSSGVEYALLSALRARGDVEERATFDRVAPVARMPVVSGSVSPTTARQIKTALGLGFDSIPVDPVALAKGEMALLQSAVTSACAVLSGGRSPIVHTAIGPGSDEGSLIDAVPGGRKRIGEGLGGILKEVLTRTGIRRGIIAGGDSSSHALGQLSVYALTTRMPLPATPGSPLCLAASENRSLDGIEIALKGGQIGNDTYFADLRDGRL